MRTYEHCQSSGNGSWFAHLAERSVKHRTTRESPGSVSLMHFEQKLLRHWKMHPYSLLAMKEQQGKDGRHKLRRLQPLGQVR